MPLRIQFVCNRSMSLYSTTLSWTSKNFPSSFFYKRRVLEKQFTSINSIRRKTNFFCTQTKMDLKPGDGYNGSGLHFTPNNHKNTLIFLHGLGDTAHGWRDFIRFLTSKNKLFDQTKFILPTAPTRPISLNGGLPMPGWADIHGLSPTDTEDEAGYTESVARVTNIIQTEILEGIPPHRIIVGGFSQGAATAYLVALHFPGTLGGVIALSGWLPLIRQSPKKFATIPDATLKTPILHCHGSSDSIVAPKWGEATLQELKSMGFKTQWIVYPGMGHSACEEEFDDIADFLDNILQPCNSSASTTQTPESA